MSPGRAPSHACDMVARPLEATTGTSSDPINTRDTSVHSPFGMAIRSLPPTSGTDYPTLMELRAISRKVGALMSWVRFLTVLLLACPLWSALPVQAQMPQVDPGTGIQFIVLNNYPIVMSFPQGSAAALGGLQSGDIIVGTNRQHLPGHTNSDLAAILASTGGRLTEIPMIDRAGNRFTLVVVRPANTNAYNGVPSGGSMGPTPSSPRPDTSSIDAVRDRQNCQRACSFDSDPESRGHCRDTCR